MYRIYTRTLLSNTHCAPSGDNPRETVLSATEISRSEPTSENRNFLGVDASYSSKGQIQSRTRLNIQKRANSRPPDATHTAVARREYEIKTPEQAIMAENIVITRLRVTDMFGVTWNMLGLTPRPKAAMPSMIGIKLRNFSMPLRLDRSSMNPARQNASNGKKNTTSTSSLTRSTPVPPSKRTTRLLFGWPCCLCKLLYHVFAYDVTRSLIVANQLQSNRPFSTAVEEDASSALKITIMFAVAVFGF